MWKRLSVIVRGGLTNDNVKNYSRKYFKLKRNRVKNSNFTVEQKEVLKKAMDILNDKVDEFENILDDENICFFNPDKD